MSPLSDFNNNHSAVVEISDVYRRDAPLASKRTDKVNKF